MDYNQPNQQNNNPNDGYGPNNGYQQNGGYNSNHGYGANNDYGQNNGYGGNNNYGPNSMYMQQEPKKSKGLAIAAMVVGILSMTLCCTVGSVLGLVGLILGIVSLSKKEDGKGMAIAGIITSAIGILVGIVFIFLLVLDMQIMKENGDLTITEMEEELIGELEGLPEENPFTGCRFQCGDGSMIYFEEDGSFIWYQSDEDHDDNYYTGTYDVYMGEDAYDYIIYDLSEYGITEEELDDYFDRNEDSDFYQKENMCCLVLHNEELFMDGKLQDYAANERHYMGFFEDGYFDAANMESGEYASFTLTE